MTNQIEWKCKECEVDNALCGCKQEPVCYLQWNNELDEPDWAEDCICEDDVYEESIPLYRHPPVDPKAHMSVMAVSAFEAGQYSMQDENVRLKKALSDAINRPKGVVPASAKEFYNE